MLSCIDVSLQRDGRSNKWYHGRGIASARVRTLGISANQRGERRTQDDYICCRRRSIRWAISCLPGLADER